MISRGGLHSIGVIGKMRGIIGLCLRLCTCTLPSMFVNVIIHVTGTLFELSRDFHDIIAPYNVLSNSFCIRLLRR